MVPSLRAMRMPDCGPRSFSVYWPLFQAGSLITASRCTARSAMANGEAADEPEMRDQAPRAARRHRRERHHHHAAQRRAHHGVELLDAERTRGFVAGAGDVFDRQFREIQPPRLARGGV